MEKFKGHKLVKLKPLKNTKTIQTDWLLDLSDFNIYKVKVDKYGNVLHYVSACKMMLDMSTGAVTFVKYMRTPVSIMKQAEKIAKFYHGVL